MANVAPGGGTVKNLAERFLTLVHADIGDPYVYGAAGPKAFDCSGLIYYNLHRLGINAPRTSEAQWAWVDHISRKDLQPGDLIFYQFSGDNAPPGHVVIYAGNGKIIQAPQAGQNVQEDNLSIMSGGQVIGYGRVPGLTGTASAVGGDATLDSAPALQAQGGLSLSSIGIPGIGLPDPLAAFQGTASTIGDIATALEGLVKDTNTALHFLAVLGKPSLWLRVGAFLLGLISAGVGVYFLGKSIGVSGPSVPTVVPIPV
jgi:hypothetical protein